MFERYLSDAVASHFGDIILNHTCSQISVSSGRLQLRDVELKKSALQHVLGNSSALDIRYGKIGQLDVQIPWNVLRGFFLGRSTAMGAAALTISVRDVNIWLAPPTTDQPQTESDCADDSDNDLSKEQKVQTTLDARIVLESDKKHSWKLRLLRSLVANLSLEVHNIHVRYEDASGLAFGLTLAEIVAQQQTATVQRCAIYWRDAYLLEPISATIDWQDIMNIKAVLPVCSVSVSRSMLQDIGYLRKTVPSLWKAESEDGFFEEERPLMPPKEDPRAWWHYAVSAVSLSRPRVGWRSLILGLRKRKNYTRLFLSFVQAKTADERQSLHSELVEFERSLSVDEIVAFRLWVYNELRHCKAKPFPTQSGRARRASVGEDEPETDNLPALLSSESRLKSFLEVAEAFRRKENTAPTEVQEPEQRQLLFKTSLCCNELSLQVSDSHISFDGTILSVPILRLSCAVDHKQDVFSDNSWNIVNRIGSLTVKDCTGSTKWFRDEGDTFDISAVNLVGPKGGDAWKDKDDEVFYLDGKPLHRSVSLEIQRTVKLSETGVFNGSTTTTKVRVLPLELLYSTAAMESVCHVIETASVDLVDDYDQLKSKVSTWRRNQQKRLLKALAHSDKTMLVDVVVGAPVLLFPEGNDPDSPMLVVNLGELRFADDTKHKLSAEVGFDDRWLLEVRLIEVQRTTSRLYCYPDPLGRSVFHRIVEPFSLNISIWTKIEDDETLAAGRTSILVHATLPRLYVNLTSSAIRVFLRLQEQWNDLKRQRSGRSRRKGNPKKVDSKGDRRIEIHFAAPLLGGRLADDGHGRDDSALKQICDLQLKGIAGKVETNSTPDLDSALLSLKVHTLTVRDTYQTGGDGFSLLLSSVAPEFVSASGSFDSPRLSDHQGLGSDLVSVHYQLLRKLSDQAIVHLSPREPQMNKLSIEFNELFVNWNPETIATISRLFVVSPNQQPVFLPDSPNGSFATDDDEFFDAPEDAFFDAAAEDTGHSDFDVSGNSSFRAILSVFSSQQEQDTNPESTEYSLPEEIISPSKPIEVAFSLAKLKVNFNKDARHRKLVAAEMVDTTVLYSPQSNGGSKTVFRIGNLTLSDCSGGTHKTLYREILGLKTDPRFSVESASLFEMEMISNPRRKSASLADIDEDHKNEPGSTSSFDIMEEGTVTGADSYISAKFSPMRFVYLHQLWQEVVDYFFCGVIGSEVWGGKTSTHGDSSVLEEATVDAGRVSFTRFTVTMESPVILLPVSSCSTDFMRIESSCISLTNYYSKDVLRSASVSLFEDDESRQWFNNCDVKIAMLEFHNWSGQRMSDDKPTLRVHLNWPVGPRAFANEPKWKVDCNIDSFGMFVGNRDYALLQHIVSYNIGEESRHMSEWRALKALSADDFERLLRLVKVPFGYEEKDAIPSTYDVSVKVESISIALRNESKRIATIKCNDMLWTYKKLSDRVSTQRLSCNPGVVDGSGGASMLYWQSDDRETERLVYVSSTEPSGSNHRTLTLSRPVFEIHPTAWQHFSSFFSDTPSPSFLSPEEAIQVGDRWYRIGGHRSGEESEVSGYSWLRGYESFDMPDDHSLLTVMQAGLPYGFIVTLVGPKVQSPASASILCLGADTVEYNHHSEDDIVRRTAEATDITCFFIRRHSNSTVAAPFSILLSYKGCNGMQCRCSSHDTKVELSAIEASGSFSDVLDLANLAKLSRSEYKELQRQESSSSFSFESHESFETALEEPQLPRLSNTSIRLQSFRVVLGNDTTDRNGEVAVLEIGETNLTSAASEPSRDQERFRERRTNVRIRSITLLDRASSAVLVDISTPGSDAISYQSDKEEDSTRSRVSVGTISVSLFCFQTQRIQDFAKNVLKATTDENEPHLERSGATKSHGFSIQKNIGEITVSRLLCKVGNKLDEGFLVEFALRESHAKFEQSLTQRTVGFILGPVSVTSPQEKGAKADDTTLFACEAANFAEVTYRQFRDGRLSSEVDDKTIPFWITLELKRRSRLDGLLEVIVRPATIVFTRSRIEEIIDCLVQLAPRRARKKTAVSYPEDNCKSYFLQLNLEHQAILIPKHDQSKSFLVLEIDKMTAKGTRYGTKGGEAPTYAGNLTLDSLSVTTNNEAVRQRRRTLTAPKLSFACHVSDGSIDIKGRCSKTLLLILSRDEIPIYLSVIRDNLSRGYRGDETLVDYDDDDDCTAATVVPTAMKVKVSLDSVCLTLEISRPAVTGDQGKSCLALCFVGLDFEATGYDFDPELFSLAVTEVFILYVPPQNQRNLLESSMVLLDIKDTATRNSQPNLVVTIENQILPNYRTKFSVTTTCLWLNYLAGPILQISEFGVSVGDELRKSGFLSGSKSTSAPYPVQANVVLNKFRFMYGDDPVHDARAVAIEGLANIGLFRQTADEESSGHLSVSSDCQNILVRFFANAVSTNHLRKRHQEILAALFPAMVGCLLPNSPHGDDTGPVISPQLSFSAELTLLGPMSNPLKRTLAISIEPLSLTVTANELQCLHQLSIRLSKSSSSEKVSSNSWCANESLNISIGGIGVTVIDDEAPAFRAVVKRSDFSLSRMTDDQTAMVRGRLSFAPSIDYHSSRAWSWEPFLEPCGLSVSFSWQEIHGSDCEFSLEVGDDGSAPCFNISDSFVAKCSRVVASNTFVKLLPSSDVEKGIVSIAAFLNSTTEKHAVKTFLLRNRCGMKISFAHQIRHPEEYMAPDLVTAFEGLSQVESGSESLFGLKSPFCSAETARHFLEDCDKHPRLVVTLETENNTVDTLEALDMVRTCETLVQVHGRRGSLPPTKFCITWSVEQVGQTMRLRLGTSVRVVSLIERAFELGVRKLHDRKVISTLGKVELGQCFDLPIWMGMERTQWVCFVRLSADDPYTPAFVVRPDGSVNLAGRQDGCIECDVSEFRHSASLSVTQEDDKGITTMYVDSTASLRNMLPSSIDWEIRDERHDEVLDGSPTRKTALTTGGFVDIMSNITTVSFRVRPCIPGLRWSSWHSFAMLMADECGAIDSEELVEVRDPLNARLPFGYRVSRKQNGFDVCVYAEIWCSNGTDLNVVFGIQAQNEQAKRETTGNDFSAAEATLKEIASLFESGDGGTGLRRENMSLRQAPSTISCTRLPGQVGSTVTEEVYEYVEIQGRSHVCRQWWASEDPFDPKPDIRLLGDVWSWLDDGWTYDTAENKVDGWESSPNVLDFLASSFNRTHRYRRRRWLRARYGHDPDLLVAGVNAFLHPEHLEGANKGEDSGIRIGVQVEGGKWSKTPIIPTKGLAFGVIRALSNQFAHGVQSTDAVQELCYRISPMDGEWGSFSRSMFVTSRFLIRNDSDSKEFMMKQSGSEDSTAVKLSPGQTIPFHWSSRTLPELISMRPVGNAASFNWSGSFDPLVIGSIPIRTRSKGPQGSEIVRSVMVDVAIRPGTGKTGINISFKEESNNGNGSLYRIENSCPLPVWVAQDENSGSLARRSDLVDPSMSVAFALDNPYARSIDRPKLLRVLLSLAPHESLAGKETARAISLSSEGEVVLLEPSQLSFLGSDIRLKLRGVAVAGTVRNDGPTRVLMLRLIRIATKRNKAIPKRVDWVSQNDTHLYPFMNDIRRGAQRATQEINAADLSGGMAISNDVERQSLVSNTTGHLKNILISFRAELSGVRVSFVDSAPSEVFVASLTNANVIGSYDTLRKLSAQFYLTISDLQVDNMVPNAPFLVAVSRSEPNRSPDRVEDGTDNSKSPLLVAGLSLAPRHESGVVCVKSATIMPRNLCVRTDIASVIRAQKLVLDLQNHFQEQDKSNNGKVEVPDMIGCLASLEEAAVAGRGRKKYHFGCLTVLPINIRLSVASARALSPMQAVLCGPEVAAIHQAVRKGDLLLREKEQGIVGVKIGSRNKTPRMVVEGMLKSVLFDGLLRLDGASLNFSGVSLGNHTTNLPQLSTAITAHYVTCLRQNVPMLLGSMAAIGNPLGLVRGLGEGAGDFVLEPFRGFQRSVQEMDASHVVDGVARGTLSLARHTVGGFADSAALLAETFSKNMTILTLDRRYAIKRDRGEVLRDKEDFNVASGLGSGAHRLVVGFVEGVTGVVRAPIRGAEKGGFEGFAKGIGKGVLGLLVKPIIGISDGFTDVMIGVKGTVDGASGHGSHPTQLRPCRALYGRDKAIRPYSFEDAAASALMMRTRLAGDLYLSHLDMGDRVALLSVQRFLILGPRGEELLVLKLKHIEKVETRDICHENERDGWGVIVILNTARQNGSEVEVIICKERTHAMEISRQLLNGKAASLREEGTYRLT